MFYALSWIVVALLLAAWSLAAWALHAVAAWTASSAGALTAGVSGAGTIAVPEWLSPWMPPEIVQWMSHLLAGLRPVVDGVLAAVPALAGGVTFVTWVIWGIGSVLLVLMGALLHLLIALWRRSGSRVGAGSDPRWRPDERF